MRLLFTLTALLITAATFSQWRKIELEVETSLYDIDFIDSYTGYIVGEDGLILKTTNSGYNWEPMESLPKGYLWDVHFVNDTLGFIAGTQGIFRTTNGGNTWIEINNIPKSPSYFSICFVNDSVGYISGLERTVLKTTDYGESWEVLDNVVTDEYSVLLNVTFTNELTGYIAGKPDYVNIEKMNFARTQDGGETWQGDTIGEGNSIESLFFINDKVGFLGDEKGVIYKTTDNGEEWNAVYKDTEESSINSIYFLDESVGYAVGGAPLKILRTKNGGITWTGEKLNEIDRFLGINFYKDQFGFVLGSNGTLYRYDNNRSSSIVSDLSSQSLNIYPNPATDYLFLNNNSSGTFIQIFELSGTKVFQQEVTGGMIDISTLKQGVYFIQLETERGIRTERFVKN